MNMKRAGLRGIYYQTGSFTIRLSSGTWQARVLPEFGMNPVSLRHHGRPVLREPYSPVQLAESPFLYGIPLLFRPIE